MADDHLYFVNLMESYVHDSGRHVPTHYSPNLFQMDPFTPIMLKTVVKKYCRDALKAQGMGRHSKEEVRAFGRNCLESLALIIDNGNKFIAGDQPCEEDCAVFGQLVWMLYNFPEDNYFKDYTKKNFKCLVDYTERMKELYWKDREAKCYKTTN